MSFLKSSSPGPRNNDLEAGGSRSGGHQNSDEESSLGPFDIISTKNASIERLRRWRQAALVLNASRRFRYTLDLKREEEKTQIIRTVKANIQAIRAANRFKEVLSREIGSPKPPLPHNGDFAIGQEQLGLLSRDHDVSTLEQYGGVSGLSDLLKTSLEKGIQGDEPDLLKRRNAFGSNTYPRKKGRSFWMFLWEAWQDLTLIILMIAAVASLALGIKTEVSFSRDMIDYAFWSLHCRRM